MRKRLIYIILGLLVALFILLNGFSRNNGENFFDVYVTNPSSQVNDYTASSGQ
jgi:hypothetical protein